MNDAKFLVSGFLKIREICVYVCLITTQLRRAVYTRMLLLTMCDMSLPTCRYSSAHQILVGNKLYSGNLFSNPFCIALEGNTLHYSITQSCKQRQWNKNDLHQTNRHSGVGMLRVCTFTYRPKWLCKKYPMKPISKVKYRSCQSLCVT